MIGATSLPITQLERLHGFARQVLLLNTKVGDGFLHMKTSCTI